MVQLSVIIPAYNAEKTIERCLKSIKEQTFQDYEVIVVNDGSIDSTAKLLDELKNMFLNMSIIYTENKGVSNARNLGIMHASGEYLTFVDSDDYLSNDFFCKMLDSIKQSKSDIVISGLAVIKNEDIIEKKTLNNGVLGAFDFWNDISKGNEMYGYIGGKLYNNSIIRENKLQFNIEMKSQEDLDFNLSYYENCNKITLINYVGYYYDYSPNKRIVPFIDLIKNQLKILNIARIKTTLSNLSQNKINERISNLIHCYLYDSIDLKDFINKINKLNSDESIHSYFQETKPILNFEIKCIIHKRYKLLYAYFKIRKLLGLIRKKL